MCNYTKKQLSVGGANRKGKTIPLFLKRVLLLLRPSHLHDYGSYMQDSKYLEILILPIMTLITDPS